MRRFGAAAAVAVLSWAIFGPPGGQRSEGVLASCGTNCFEKTGAVAYSSCGSCTTTGTEMASTLPTQWSVPIDAEAFDVMDEAAWLINVNNANISTEVGYVSGWWSYSNPNYFEYGIMAYGTWDKGTYGYASPNNLTGGSSFQAYVLNTGQDGQAYQSGSLFWNCHLCFPLVTTPRYNYSQGEIHAWDTDNLPLNGVQPCPVHNDCFPWLNNCSPGEQFTMSFTSSSGGWAHWGNIQQQAPASPYWMSKQNNYQWTNGGC
jgi:hypothetical protein